MPVGDWIMLGFAGVYTLILISVLLNIGGFEDWVTKRSQKNLRDVEAGKKHHHGQWLPANHRQVKIAALVGLVVPVIILLKVFA